MGIKKYLERGIIPDVSYSNLSAFTPGGVEDCLFLDVVTPRAIFDQKLEQKRDPVSLKPVLVWIHGGGYAAGSKTSFGTPYGLLDRSHDGLVYVALNYRLGGFGWLSGPSFEREGGVLNAGLHDQRMALQWIQDHIHLFGGDKAQVTVMGESAGAGSILHHLTGEAGRLPPLFRRAIPQSPAYFPYRSAKNREDAFRSFLGHANVSTLAEARRLPSAALVKANADAIGQAPPFSFPIYGPTPDGSLVLSDPKLHLRRGEFDHSVSLLVSHTSNEGLVLVPAIHTNEQYVGFLRNLLTRASNKTITFIAHELFPPIFDGSWGYTDNYQRAARTAAYTTIDCNARALNEAYTNTSFSYRFALSPGLHTQDVPYTFYWQGHPPSGYSLVDTGPVNETVAFAIQDYIVEFAKTGDPESTIDGLPGFPKYGGGRFLGLDDTAIRID